MRQSPLLRWIEEAEAKRVGELAHTQPATAKAGHDRNAERTKGLRRSRLLAAQTAALIRKLRVTLLRRSERVSLC